MINNIVSQLPEHSLWKDRIHHFPTVASTNTLAKTMAANGAPHGTVLIADSQTGGRGRMGRSFHSPDGRGIYLSVILRPECPVTQLMHLTCAAAVAMCEAIEAACTVTPGIKWTNDLVYNGRKLGGILTELSVEADARVSYAVIGIGINCTQTLPDFPEDIRNIATSLSLATGAEVSRTTLAAKMIAALEEMSRKLLTQKSEIMDAYRKYCITVGREISLNSGDSVRHGTAVGIDDEGALLVVFPGGHQETVSAGEISIRGMYGYI